MAYEKAKVFLFTEQKVLTTDASQARAAGPSHSHLLRPQVTGGWNDTLAEAAAL